MIVRTARVILPFLILAVATASARAQGTVLVEAGSSMKYKDNPIDPGIAGLQWTEENFVDSGWFAGTYGVGYDTSGTAVNLIQTPVQLASASVFTRAVFEIADISTVTSLFLGADFDDGYIAWINGVEVYRSPQMPAGAPAWNTPSGLHESSNGPVPDYGALRNITDLGVPELHNGFNVLAVGVWNGPLPSSDLVLVPQLTRDLPLPPPRGPYLQNSTDTSLVVRWRTDTLTDSRVQFNVEAGPTVTIDDPTPVTNHEVEISGLNPDTQYFYSVGSTTAVFAGGDPDHFFRTAPAIGARRSIRAWVIGDSGTADANADAVRDAYLAFNGGPHADLWLMLGDNAYSTGTDDEYQAAVFETYPAILRTTVLWSTMGNHDAVSASSSTFRGPYYDIFNLPSAWAGQGMPSGTEAYYSFDFGNVHFVCLNSQDVNRSPPPDPNGVMLDWLEQDLMNTTQDWIVAFWHHPPYSKGSHDSDNSGDSGGRLIDMRENALPILENWGVDLVLTGHSHSYERSFLLDGHYGLSGTLTAGMKPAGDTDGRIDGDGAYQKATAGPAAHEGAVYLVAGSSGRLSGGALNHPAMYISLNQLGSLVLDFDGDRLQGIFVGSLPIPLDHFTMVKNTGNLPQADFSAAPVAGAAPLTVDFTDLSTTNTAAWSWDLDGDSLIDSTERNPSLVFGTPGLYTVELTASNLTGSDLEAKSDHICVSEGTPAATTGLGLAPDEQSLFWSPASGAYNYDLVKGDLGSLRSTLGSYSDSLLGCLEDGGADLMATDPDAPAPGSGFFYLVRGVGLCGEEGSYDSGGSGQSQSRDAGIQASPVACP